MTITTTQIAAAKHAITTQLGVEGEDFYGRLGYYTEDESGRQYAHHGGAVE